MVKWRYRVMICGILIAAGSLLTVLAPANALAHVFITDAKGQTGAVLHIIPNDDPVAGESTSLAFEIQTDIDISNWAARLDVNTPSSDPLAVPAIVNKNSVVADVVFPASGVYNLDMSVRPKDNSATPISFKYILSVRPGLGAAGPNAAVPIWPVAAAVTAVWGLGVLTIAGYDHRHSIAKNRL